jgi:biopolymer transport protein ExbD
MKLSNKKDRRMPEIDVGAFSDIAFLLIIFFILTTTFAKPAGSNIEIPSGSTDPSKKSKQITVVLKGDKILYGEKSKSVDLEELKRLLAEQKFKEKKADKRMVVLESHKNVVFDQYYKIVMAINATDGILALVEKEK